MPRTLLITGARGLVGRMLCPSLRNAGFCVKELDLCGVGESRGDVTRYSDMERAVRNCAGVVHLAAVSRVVWGQQERDRCLRTNVGGIQNLIDVARAQGRSPWILFSSSREVYGQAPILPVPETSPQNPLNVYARSKVEGERLLLDARNAGLQTAVVRLSNVYGCTKDHADRVIPAFSKAAVEGQCLRVEGPDHTFDFTHVNDVVRGIGALICLLESGNLAIPPVHLVSGQPTTLGQLASMCCRIAKSNSPVTSATPRSYDVERFFGDPTRARELLGWQSEIPLETGLRRLIDNFRQELTLSRVAEVT